MDVVYKNIVIDGYLKTPKHFDKYLVREFNKVKDNGYGVEEFFDGCLDAVEEMEQKTIKKINNEWYKQEDEIQKSIQINLKGEAEFEDDYLPGLTYEEKRNHIIKYYEQRLDEIYKIKEEKINSIDFTPIKKQIGLTKQNVLNAQQKKGNDKPFMIHNALFNYYLQESKTIKRFYQEIEGKEKAIKRLVKENSYGSWKSFQLVFNRISNYENNRIAANQIENIRYVANVMLKEYPVAQKLALNELKAALLKR